MNEWHKFIELRYKNNEDGALTWGKTKYHYYKRQQTQSIKTSQNIKIMFLQARRLVAKQQNVNVVKRTLRTTTKRKNNMFNQILEGDSGKGLLSTKFYHYTVYGSVALFPVALALSPSKLNIPVDVALGLIFPIHAHIGMNYVISDYVPKAFRSAARTGWLGVTAVTILGLLKLNLFGDGMTESVKSMFREVSPEERRAIEAAKAPAAAAPEEKTE